MQGGQKNAIVTLYSNDNRKLCLILDPQLDQKNKFFFVQVEKKPELKNIYSWNRYHAVVNKKSGETYVTLSSKYSIWQRMYIYLIVYHI